MGFMVCIYIYIYIHINDKGTMGFLTRDYTGITMRIMRDVTAVISGESNVQNERKWKLHYIQVMRGFRV